jgi:glycosyltransferase involved in cell wall biosynthesis
MAVQFPGGPTERPRRQDARLRIAQVAPLYESVPPKFYGGTERVVSYLTEELVTLGHEVTLFASGDSRTRARLRAGSPRALRLDGSCADPLARHFVHLEQAFESAAGFDVLHLHTDYLHYPFARRSRTPHLTTLHGRLDLPDLEPVYQEYGDIPLVSISDSQRAPMPDANWLGTVHHGLPRSLLSLGPGDGGYLAFLGRISPEKRVDRAIEIARRAGWRLTIAAKVDRADIDYFEREIRRLLRQPHVEFVGEISETEKPEFLGRAAALLFPIDWPEPFGLVLIEAMACGTPIVAFRGGAVEEIVEDGVNGYLVDSVREAVETVERLDRIDRVACREVFERRFTARRMALDYLRLYRRIAEGSESRGGHRRVELEGLEGSAS